MLNSIFRDRLFEGKTALVTGGGTGIGLRTARELAKLGATVILASRKEAHLEAGRTAIEAEGGKVRTVVCNIRDEESVVSCLEMVAKDIGNLDLLVNNAGGQFPSPAEAITPKGWRAVIETNLTGTFFMSQEVFKRFFKGRGGAMVNVIANMWKGFPLMAHTGAARAGVDNLTKTLAVEWGKYGVRVNAVAPGIIDSSGLKGYDAKMQAMLEVARGFNQTARLGTEAETSAAIVFLLSPAAAFITGETLKVDGGDSLYSPIMPPSPNQANPAFDDEDEVEA